MASTFVLSADKVANSALGLLFREHVIAQTITAYTDDDFKGALNHTITVPIRARATARRFAINATGNARKIVVDDLTESSVGVKLDTVIYHATGITDEQATLDLRNFGEQILSPQMIAVAEDTELLLYDAMRTAPYAASNVVTWSAAGTLSAYAIAARARKQLNRANVPGSDRFLLVGPEAEERILTDKRLDSANPEGLKEDGLRNGVIGRIAGFTVVTSNLVADDDMFAYHKSAFAFGNVAPIVPQGAKTGKRVSAEGFALRWIADYDADMGTDRSVVTTYAGAASVNDSLTTSAPASVGDSEAADATAVKTNVRAVKVKLTA